jgi:hypothetical protein
MHRKLTTLALIFALAFPMPLAVSNAAAQQQQQQVAPALTVPLNITQGTLSFVGSLNVQSFDVQGGQLVALGTVSGTLTDLTTGVQTIIARTFSAAVGILPGVQATCEILHLELGPIDLNLLGLIIHVDKIVIDITADPGGGLLGQLLCAIANALDPLNLNRLARLLADILALLG